MHQHVVAFTAWRYRRDMPGAEATLRRVAEEGILLVSTGGADQTHPRGEATKVDGGYVVSGRKVFCSQSSAGAVMSTMFAYDDPEQGRRVLNMAVPIASEGVTILDDWDTLGMRGTASNSIVLEDVFVPDERVLANRPYGVIDPPLQVIFSIAFPIISGVYLGVAEAAYEAALDAAATKANDPIVQRQIGLMRHRLQVASWALDGALDEVGDDPTPSVERVAAVMAAKREIALAGVEVCDLAMEVGGGPAYFKGSVDRALLPRHPGGQVPPAEPRAHAGARRPPRIGTSRRRRALIGPRARAGGGAGRGEEHRGGDQGQEGGHRRRRIGHGPGVGRAAARAGRIGRHPRPPDLRGRRGRLGARRHVPSRSTSWTRTTSSKSLAGRGRGARRSAHRREHRRRRHRQAHAHQGGPHPLDEFRRTIELNLIATFNLNRLAGARTCRRTSPRTASAACIINTASIAAFEGQIGQVAYTAAKAGIAGMTLTMARDLGSLGIRVLSIAPSLFSTGITQGIPDEFADVLTKDAAFPKRMGRPEEYGKLAVAIVENPMLNGSCIRLDAGQRFAPK